MLTNRWVLHVDQKSLFPSSWSSLAYFFLLLQQTRTKHLTVWEWVGVFTFLVSQSAQIQIMIFQPYCGHSPNPGQKVIYYFYNMWSNTISHPNSPVLNNYLCPICILLIPLSLKLLKSLFNCFISDQCLESRLQVKMNSPDSSRAISIKQEEPEDHPHFSKFNLNPSIPMQEWTFAE